MAESEEKSSPQSEGTMVVKLRICIIMQVQDTVRAPDRYRLVSRCQTHLNRGGTHNDYYVMSGNFVHPGTMPWLYACRVLL